MNSLLRTTLVFAFIVCLSGTYADNTLWAHGGGGQVGDEFDEYTDPANAKKIVKVIDRVCETLINKAKAKRLKKNKHVYYFCSKKCKAVFKKNPGKYACICPDCNCSHCIETDQICKCAEIEVYIE